MKILIVDDSITSRKLIEKMLRDIDYEELVLASSAKEAQAIFAAGEAIDLVLLDWHMPEIDGLQYLRHLKKDETTKQIPVIMLTVENSMENVSLAIESGAEGYILKPLNAELLKTRLKDIEDNRTLGLKK